MLSNKKGQGLPLNTIIISIIVIVVLVVVILIFTGQITLFNKTATDCAARGGDCVPADKCDAPMGALGCTAKGTDYVCCPKIQVTP